MPLIDNLPPDTSCGRMKNAGSHHITSTSPLRKWRLKGSAAHLRNEPAQSVLRACAAFARVRRSAPAAGSWEEGVPSFVLSAGSPARAHMLCFCGEKTFTGLRGTAYPHAPPHSMPPDRWLLDSLLEPCCDPGCGRLGSRCECYASLPSSG